MIYRFRVILDHAGDDDIFRDIEIRQYDTLEDLHNTIVQAFGFEGGEMASFYRSNDNWDQGEEISLFDMSEGGQPVTLMQDSVLQDVANADQTKLIYVYDFLNMWTFFVELGEIVDAHPGTDYPNLLFATGQIPNEAPQLNFDIDLDLSDLDTDLDPTDPEDLDFEDNWN